MKTVVFGGSGFLGSHVADSLTARGHEVTVFDINPSPYLSRDQRMIVGSVLDEAKVEEAVRGADVVYNFAGIADLEEASDRPLDSVRLNILGNSIILEACRLHAIKRYVFASSLYVYSRSGGFYKATKQSCELIIQNYQEVYGVPYTVLRYGSLYGPRSDDRNAIHSFLRQALAQGKITRRGDGQELREYIHVLDAAQGSVDILTPEFENQHVIITGYQQMKVRDVLAMIREMLQNRVDIEYLPASKDSYHYEITPYSFAPSVGRRLTSKCYLDLGQGILNMIHELHGELQRENPVPASEELRQPNVEVKKNVAGSSVIAA